MKTQIENLFGGGGAGGGWLFHQHLHQLPQFGSWIYLAITCLQYFLVDCQEYVPICMYAPQIGEASFDNVHCRMILVSEKHGVTRRISIEILFQTMCQQTACEASYSKPSLRRWLPVLGGRVVASRDACFFRLKWPSAGPFCFEAISLVDALQVDQALGCFMSFYYVLI